MFDVCVCVWVWGSVMLGILRPKPECRNHGVSQRTTDSKPENMV